jgi:hypothetical protein
MHTMWTGIDGRPRAGAWTLLVATLVLLLLAAERTAADAQAPPTRNAVHNAALLTGSPSLEQLITLEFGADAPAALRIAQCESRLRSVTGSRNTDGTHDWGVFQLNDGGTLQELGGTPDLALLPEWNVAAAHTLFTRHGWKRWQCKPDGTRRG